MQHRKSLLASNSAFSINKREEVDENRVSLVSSKTEFDIQNGLKREKFAMVFYGIMINMPISVNISNLDFYNKKLAEYDPQFIFTGVIISMFIVGQLLGLWLLKNVSTQGKLLVALAPQIFAFSAIPFFVQYLETSLAFYLTLFCIMLIGFCVGIMKAVMLGLAGISGHVFVGFIMLGIGLTEILMISVKFVVLMVFPGNEELAKFNGSLLYYGLCILLIIIACL